MKTPPVIILGGGANALSVARSVGRLGAEVYALNEPGAFVGHSRYCRMIDIPARDKDDRPRAWAEFLLGPESEHLRGAVLLACSDEGIEVLLAHRDPLSARYLLDESNPDAQRQMLNKLRTYEAAVAAGVPTPKFWVIDSIAQLQNVCNELVYPLVVKPRLSHVFEGRSGKKLIVAQSYHEAAAAVAEMAAAGSDCVLMEKIGGGDDLLCSYYTYLDADSRPLFHFTKRIIRRYPALTGTACYHVTDWIPEAGELANQLFRHVRLRGLANVEFKRDARDGKLKLIECNARFTASDCLVAGSGFNLGAFVYNRLTGRPQIAMEKYTIGKRLWDPIRDFQAYLGLRKINQLSFFGWLAGVMHRQTFPYFQWSDPMPALARLTAPLRKKIGMAKPQPAGVAVKAIATEAAPARAEVGCAP